MKKHLPWDVLTDLEDTHGELMAAAFRYGTLCEPGAEPLLSFLSAEEHGPDGVKRRPDTPSGTVPETHESHGLAPLRGVGSRVHRAFTPNDYGPPPRTGRPVVSQTTRPHQDMAAMRPRHSPPPCGEVASRHGPR